MKAEKSRELFTVVKTFTVPNFGNVELVKGDIHDVVISVPPLYKYRGSCNRCCFHRFWGCSIQTYLPEYTTYLPECIDDIGPKFYRRKTAENIQK